jgi:tetratricopeptide (TPR) repeat protein
MLLRLAFSFLALSLLTLRAAAADADALFKQGLAAETALDSKKALEFFRQADQARPNDAATLQKISKQLSDSTFGLKDETQKKKLIEEALTYAKRSYELEPKNAIYALSVAICYGKLGLYEDNRSRISHARMVKEYAEKALELDPNYAWASHVLGRWNYEVATLGATKRFFVGLVYGGLPEASTARGVELLKRAVELDPKNPAHLIDLGFAYMANKQPDLAKKAFTEGLALPSTQSYDEETKALGKAALAKLGG